MASTVRGEGRTAEPRVPAGGPAAAYERYERVFQGIDPPFAFVDLDAMWRNAAGLLGRAGSKPIRVATKSIRCRALLERILARNERFAGLMSFTLAETLWLVEHGFEDLLLAYPTADREALRALGRLEAESPPALIVDSVYHLDLIEAAAGRDRRAIRVCIEIDVSWQLAGGRIRIGAKRSPVRTPEQVEALAREVARRPGFELAGLMGYEAHIAGLGDAPPRNPLKRIAIGVMQRASAREIAERRAACVEAAGRVAPLEIVNAGGTGSLHLSSAEACVTEVTAGSGFYAPALFDHYSAFRLEPAAMFALPVSRRPGPGVVTCLGGGYLASGAADELRLPVAHLPPGLSLDPMEGAGEVQTPLHGEAAGWLRVGDRVYLRHAKAGELCERFDRLLLVEGGELAGEVPTYRGEGRSFL